MVSDVGVIVIIFESVVLVVHYNSVGHLGVYCVPFKQP